MVRATHGQTTKKDKYRNDVPSPGIGITVYGEDYEDILRLAVVKAGEYFGVVPEGREIATSESFDAVPYQYAADGRCIKYKATLHCQLRTLNPLYDPLAGTALEDDEEEDEDLDDDD